MSRPVSCATRRRIGTAAILRRYIAAQSVETGLIVSLALKGGTRSIAARATIPPITVYCAYFSDTISVQKNIVNNVTFVPNLQMQIGLRLSIWSNSSLAYCFLTSSLIFLIWGCVVFVGNFSSRTL